MAIFCYVVNYKLFQNKMAAKNVRWRHYLKWRHMRNNNTFCYSGINFGNNTCANNESTRVYLNYLHLQNV